MSFIIHLTMAALVGVVAGGFGLASLTIQLLDGAERLRALYKASKNVPRTVNELVFEPETMSLSLRQLEQHYPADSIDGEHLEWCTVVCRLKTNQICEVVENMEVRMRKCYGIGRLYSAFKELEIQNLTDDLERAKSPLTFAYMMYRQ